MQTFNTKKWIRVILLNLAIVAFLGTLMRYKIGFEFPFLDQKHLQLSHSHFAFCGWITQTLLVLILSQTHPFLREKQIRNYNWLLWANLITAYGMLVSFIIQGYAAVSIAFSTISVLVTIAFAAFYFAQSGQLKAMQQATKWIRTALAFAVLSAGGTVVLAAMMVSHHIHQNTYLASIYFYLHFQYNGWFFLACIGLFVGWANLKGITIKNDKLIYGLLAGSCIPAYFLSTLWASLPLWLYILVVIAAFAQAAGWWILVRDLFRKLRTELSIPAPARFLVYYVTIAGSVKFLLQLGSTIPAMSTLAFGFRPIVIAYLHLVLLAFISHLLILYLYGSKQLAHSRGGTLAIFAFASGVLLNELVLAIQGVTSFGYIVIPFTNEILFAIALLLFLSAIWLFSCQFFRQTLRP